jgi:hypothetical protein
MKNIDTVISVTAASTPVTSPASATQTAAISSR